MIASHLRSVVFDCHQPAALARFWAETLGYSVRRYDGEDIARLQEQGYTPETDPSVVIDPPAAGPTIWFNRVPDAKSGKNRVHLDVNLANHGDVDTLVARGARILRGPAGSEDWYIMADPEGNEFCAFPQGRWPHREPSSGTPVRAESGRPRSPLWEIEGVRGDGLARTRRAAPESRLRPILTVSP